ncbi:palmitoyltransferase ZDHHC3-like [Rhopilema esculentum]|uniref:palmitoyltransferase ZDHHC3-like n=1 Tax=Rhopilema esculentum TaxID=499914 RepID=UPI0031D693C6
MVFRKDPCGITCLVITYGCVLYCDYCIIDHVILPTFSSSLWGAFHATMFNSFLFLLAYSHLKASFCDPGVVPLPYARLDFSDIQKAKKKKPRKAESEWGVCSKCEAYKPPRAHHCRICNRCIKKMDHHCPWINNCVGEQNQKFFILFLFYTGISSIYGLSLGVFSLFKRCHDCTDKYEIGTRIFHVVILLVVCSLFSLFVLCIMYDQIYSIYNDITLIEQVQKEERQNSKPKMALLMEIFGRGPKILWLLPCSNPRQTTHTTDYSV